MNNWILGTLLAAFVVAANGQFNCGPNDYGSMAACKPICKKMYDTLFTFGECYKVEGCEAVCAFDVRLWTIVFIFATFVAVVIIIIFMLPLCVSSCVACFAARKGNKRAKQVHHHQQAGGGELAMSGGGMEVVPSKGGAGQQQYMYNPYAYWPYYGRMG